MGADSCGELSSTVLPYVCLSRVLSSRCGVGAGSCGADADAGVVRPGYVPDHVQNSIIIAGTRRWADGMGTYRAARDPSRLAVVARQFLAWRAAQPKASTEKGGWGEVRGRLGAVLGGCGQREKEHGRKESSPVSKTPTSDFHHGTSPTPPPHWDPSHHFLPTAHGRQGDPASKGVPCKARRAKGVLRRRARVTALAGEGTTDALTGAQQQISGCCAIVPTRLRHGQATTSSRSSPARHFAQRPAATPSTVTPHRRHC